MLTRRFGKTNLTIPAVGLGCWNLGNQWGDLSDADAAAIIDAAWNGGIRLYDVAESYGIPNGASEIRVGRTLADRAADRILVSKVGNWGKRTGGGIPKDTVDQIRVCGHACCGRLGASSIDVMLCHEASIEDPSVYIAGFRALRDEGFIGHYGISTNNLEVLKRFVDMSDGECAVLEFDYSLVNRAPEDELIPYCQAHDIGMLARGPIAMGILSGRYDEDTVFTDPVRVGRGWNADGANRDDFLRRLDLARQAAAICADQPDLTLPSAAIRYITSHPAGIVVIPGATSVRQADANAAAGADVLPAHIYQALRELPR